MPARLPWFDIGQVWAEQTNRWTQAMMVAMTAVLLTGCATGNRHSGWFALRWMEKPGAHGPSTQAAPQDQTQFKMVASFDAQQGEAAFHTVQNQIREGDVIAYRMSAIDAYRDMLMLKLNKVAYGVFRYGHLAIVVDKPGGASGQRLFSSQSFKGPNVAEDLDTLRSHDFDVYRLDKWDRVNRDRLHEFVHASIQKAGKWYGYDFSGMFGLINSNLRPTSPKEIGHDYICSTVVVGAFYYAGLELDAIKRDGVLDIVTPAQVIASRGRLFPGRDIALEAEGQEYN